MKQSVVIPVADASQVGEARRALSRLGDKIGLGETALGKLSLIVTEVANNLIKHAGQGHLLARCLGVNGDAGLEIVALDRGGGMNNVAQCMRDGYSTAGSPGTGLGAIARLSATFDIYSTPGCGTAVVARVYRAAIPSNYPLEFGAVCIATTGEEICGDSWSVRHGEGRISFLVVDGLGHGGSAAQAAHEAVAVFEEHATRSPAEILRAAHGRLRSTRGAAMAIAETNLSEGIIRYAGVGNIAATIISGGATRSLVSHNGTVGHEMPRVQEFVYPWPEGALLVMHSDGLQTRWSFDGYPGLAARHPAVIAGVLYRDFRRTRDDASVLVARRPALRI